MKNKMNFYFVLFVMFILANIVINFYIYFYVGKIYAGIHAIFLSIGIIKFLNFYNR